MRKTIITIMILCMSLLCHAQHLTFMGIPINGTISSFQEKLIKKGLKPSKGNKFLPKGVREFEGYFANKQAEIVCFYNVKTNVINQCRVVLARVYNSKEEVLEAFNSYKQDLDSKYRDRSLNDDNLDSEYKTPDSFTWFVLQQPVEVGSRLLGLITLSINEGEYASQYKLWIDYIDYIGFQENEEAKKSDL